MSFTSIFTRRGRASLLRGARAYLGSHGVSRARTQSLRILYRMRMQLILRVQHRLSRIVGQRDVRLYVDGPAAFARIEKLLRIVRHTVLIHMFIWKDDATGRRIAEHIVRAADRGVHVQIIKDMTGDFFELHQDFLATRNSKQEIWKRFWHHPNIDVEQGSERNHAKVFVFDEDFLLLGGMNIADEYHYEWHDFLIELRGRKFVEGYLTNAFGSVTGDRVSLIANTQRRLDVRPAITRLLQSAQREIVLEQAYFADPEIIALLAACSHRDVFIRLILPAESDIHSSANAVAVGMLLEEGDPAHIQVFHYPGMLHGKLILVDRETAFIGSTNLITSSLDTMGELNVLLRGKRTRVLRRVREVVRRDLLHSFPILSPPRLRWITRILAWMGL